MPVKWKIYRVVCIVQMMAAAIFAIISVINFFQDGGLGELMRILLFVFIFLLTILALNILNNNYPDVPVTGRQKTAFNRLFLLNFLFLTFLFGIVFAEYRELQMLADLISKNIFSLPFEIFLPVLVSLGLLAFQFVILYGLYQLRRELYMNFLKKEFEFEKETGHL
jgi:hypothetical protein